MNRRWFLMTPAACLGAARKPLDAGIHVLTTASGTEPWRGMLNRVLALDYVSGLGKLGGFGLMVQGMSPEWVKRQCDTFTFEHIHPAVGARVSPIPWDTGYQAALARTVAAIGKRLDGQKRISREEDRAAAS